MSVQEGWGIRISDKCFIKRGPSRLSYLLETYYFFRYLHLNIISHFFSYIIVNI